MRNHAQKSGGAAKKAFRKPIGRQITFMSICCILITVAVTALLLLAGSSVQTNSILEDDTKTAMTSLRQNVADMNTGAAKCASDLAKDDVLVSSLQGNGRSTIAMTIGMAAKDLGSDVDFITVTDAQGKVLACTVSEQSGESVADMQDVKAALGGTASKGLLEKGADVKLAVRAAAPVVNNGKIIGVISAGYDLSRNHVLNTLKQNTGCDFSFFLGDTLLNSTATSSGKTADAAVTGQVISRKTGFAGQTNLSGVPYYAHYDPMTDASGSVIGMYFAGKPIASIEASRRQFILLIVLVTVLLSAISIFTFYRFSKKRIAEPLRNMSEMAAQLASGNLAVSIPQTSSDDEIGLLANSLGTMAKQLRLYVGDISRQLSQMSQGDMTSNFEIDYIGDFAPIRNALQGISGSLNKTLAQINSSAQLVSESAGQVAGGSQSLAQGATEQASTVEELSTMVGDVARKVNENSDGVHSMAEALSQAGADVEKTNKKTKNMLEAMAGIQESSDKIEEIIKSIDTIAFQTNILALNAAVEAARAGEAGKGFAVVADEVRNLAGKSAEASKQTATLISDTRDKVRVGCGLAEETAKGAQDINEKIRLVMQSMDAITSASAAQSAAVARINQGIFSVSGVVQTNSATSQECAAASADLSRQAGLLRGEVEKFRLKEAKS